MTRVLLFDLDDTLMVEEPAATAAFAAVAQFAASVRDVDAAELAVGARSRARELWYAAPMIEYCLRVGISSWEGLWCRFEGERPDARLLRDWAPDYRKETWRLALLDHGVDDPSLARDLGEQFGIERRSRHEVFEDVDEALGSLCQSYSLVLVTNGAACLQREKLAASGLGDYFEAVVVSEDLGVAKPDAAVFEHAMSMIDADPGQTVMIGDSLAKDVEGALAAGLRAVWVNRNRAPRPRDRPDLVEIFTLNDLPTVVTTLA
jgi:putative hydrolase of the HAD superfamily